MILDSVPRLALLDYWMAVTIGIKQRQPVTQPMLGYLGFTQEELQYSIKLSGYCTNP
jgi:hypothetical protein